MMRGLCCPTKQRRGDAPILVLGLQREATVQNGEHSFTASQLNSLQIGFLDMATSYFDDLIVGGRDKNEVHLPARRHGDALKLTSILRASLQTKIPRV